MKKSALLLFSLVSLNIIQLSLAASCFATLYESDPIRSGISFPNGTYATIYKDYFPYHTGVDISFTGDGYGRLQIANDENKLASMVDLGAQRELANLYQIGSVAAVYLSIHVEENGHLMIAQNTTTKTFQPIDPRSISLLQTAHRTPMFEPSMDHIMLINITDITDPSFMRLVKLLIVNWIPPTSDTSPSVTIRWDVLLETKADQGVYDLCHILGTENGDESLPRYPPTNPRTSAWVPVGLIGLLILVAMEFVVIVAVVVWVKAKMERMSTRYYETLK